jgi:GDP-mannose transporter
MAATSRPATPAGLSPRGSYINLADAAEPGTPLFNANRVDEKGRLKAESEAESLLRSEMALKADRAKKEEVGMPAGSPSESSMHSLHRTDASVWPILSYCLASIMMTVVNKFVVSGYQFTMTFFRA